MGHRINYILFVIFLILISYNLNSQEYPESFKDSTFSLSSKNEIELKVTEIPNVDSLLSISDSLYQAGINHPQFYGVEYDSDISLKTNGNWDTLINGDRIWRYHIICPGAKTINILLDDVKIGNNSNISFYNEDNESLLGPYNKRINNETKIFSSHLIEGQSIFIELFEAKSDFETNKFRIDKIVYGYLESSEINNYSKLSTTQSAPCHIDANCLEGDEFCREKYSVAIILAPSHGPNWGHCTGTLINNTENNYVPYLLTAFHCIDKDKNNSISLIEKGYLSQWSYKFGYMRYGCNSGSVIQTKEYSGSVFRSAWKPTDFLLVELLTKPISGETNFNDVYFNGWDITGNTPDNVAILHHPARDKMKISLDSDSPTTWETYFWHVLNWDHGTTEGGSSGGALLNENHKIVGQNLGQPEPIVAPCHPDKNTVFGKLSLSWNGGGSSDSRLKDWLDPNNKGVTTLDGIKMPNLLFGASYSGTYNLNAYTNYHIGGSHFGSFTLYPSSTGYIKAGKEIRISACTYIKKGSEFRAFIEDPNCNDVILLSNKYSSFNPNVCSFYFKFAQETNHFEKEYRGVPRIIVSPNPVTSISDIKLTVGAADNVSLMLYDNLGNQRFSYLDNISLKSGTYNYKLDGNELNSGMFVLILKIDGRIITEKIINLK